MPSAVAALPKPITPGAKPATLLRFHPDITWTGTISAGGMRRGCYERFQVEEHRCTPSL